MTAGLSTWNPNGTKSPMSAAQLERMRAALGAAAATGFTASTAGRTFTPDDAFQIVPYTGASPMNIPAGLLTPAGNIGWRATVVGAGVLSWPGGVTVALASDGELTPLVSPLNIDAAVWSLGQYHPSNAALFVLDVRPAFSLSAPREYTAPQVETSVSLGENLTGTVSVNCANRSVFHGGIADGAQVVFECDGMLNGQTVQIVLARASGNTAPAIPIYITSPTPATTLYVSGTTEMSSGSRGAIIWVTRRGSSLTRFVEITQLVPVATPDPPPPVQADMLLQLDGNLTDAAGNFTPTIAAGTPVYLSDGAFGQALAWDGSAEGWLGIASNAALDPVNGFEIETRLYYANYGSPGSPPKTGVIFMSGAGVSFGFYIQPVQGNIYLMNGPTGNPAPIPRDQYSHVVCRVRLVGGQKKASLAVNGSWAFVDAAGANVLDGAHSVIMCGDTSINPSPPNPHRYSYVVFRRDNPKYVPGVNFTPPTDPPTLNG